MDWIKIEDRKPIEREKCLVACKGLSEGIYYYNVAQYTEDLYKIDEYDFSDRKGKAGFYDYDSEWGWFEYLNVVAWMPIPKYTEKKSRTV